MTPAHAVQDGLITKKTLIIPMISELNRKAEKEVFFMDGLESNIEKMIQDFILKFEGINKESAAVYD